MTLLLGPFSVPTRSCRRWARVEWERFTGRGTTRLERTVAVKVLRTHLATSLEVRQRFGREAMAVPVRAGEPLEFGAPVPLFRSPTATSNRSALATWNDYAVSPDGQRFLIRVDLISRDTMPVTVAVGWSAGIAR